jgi:hypothetical protein
MITQDLAEQLGDVAESIAKIKGPKYMSLVAHMLNFRSIDKAIQRSVEDKGLIEMIRMSHACVLADLADAAGVNIENDEEKKELDRNFDVVQDSINKALPR